MQMKKATFQRAQAIAECGVAAEEKGSKEIACELYRRSLGVLSVLRGEDDHLRLAALQYAPDDKIAAIKEVRNISGKSLKDAKEFVDGVWPQRSGGA